MDDQNFSESKTRILGLTSFELFFIVIGLFVLVLTLIEWHSINFQYWAQGLQNLIYCFLSFGTAFVMGFHRRQLRKEKLKKKIQDAQLEALKDEKERSQNRNDPDRS